MFVRFRAGRRRLALSLVETKRTGDRVLHEHVATLGSVDTPPTVRGRVAFWAQLDRRLTALGNRVRPEDQSRIMDTINARVPIPTIDEQREVKLENAKADERFWSMLQDMNADQAQGAEQLSASAAAKAARNREAAAAAKSQTAEAAERVGRLMRGEDVPGGLGKPVDFATLLREAGFTKDELHHIAHVTEATDAFGLAAVTEATTKAYARAERRVVRQLAQLASLVERPRR
jgi:hypothetical protein